MKIVVHHQHPLSRFRKYNLLKFDGGQLRNGTIELVFWHTMLFQLKKGDECSAILFDNAVRRNSAIIPLWLKNRNVILSAKWIFHCRQVYVDILLDQLQDDQSQFRKDLQEIIVSVRNPREIQFVASGTDYVWSTGIRYNAIDSYAEFPGFNVYGQILNDVLHQFLSNSLTPRYGVSCLMSTIIDTGTSCSKTVLVLSDSFCRQVESIAGGTIISVSGAKYHELVVELQLSDINILDYRYFIVHCGANMAALTDSARQQSWRPLFNLLTHVANVPNGPIVLMSTTVPHPSIPQMRSHSRGIKAQLRHTGVLCLDWSDYQGGPFSMDNQEFRRLFCGFNKFHLNHAGFRHLWRAWCNYLFHLRYVSYKMVLEHYAAKRNHHGDIL